MATHDYVIANASGAAVRQDINNALAAIVSNNSSATEPGTTYAFQFWFDTTNNILKIRNAANSAWIDWITTTATVLLPDGAVGTPSLTFASETDTGLYRIAANTLGIATSGTERVEISDTGIIINEGGEAAIDVRIEGDSDANLVFIDAGNDRVGIGDSSPDARCVVYRATQFAGNPAFSVKTDAGSTKSTRFMVDGDGKVGVGTSSPFRSVHVSGSSDQYVRITSTNSANAGIEFGDSDDAGRASVIYSNSTDSMFFTVNGSERARIDSSGRVLLGASSSVTAGSTAGAMLQVEHGSGSITGALYCTADTAQGGTLVLGHGRGSATGVLQDGDTLGDIRFAGADGTDLQTQGARITATVDGTPGSNDMPGRLVFSTTADGASSPTEHMRLNSSGRLLVGTTSTDMVNNTSGGGCVLDGGGINASASGENVFNFNRSNGDGTIGSFRSQGNFEGSVSISGSTCSFNGGHLSRWTQLAGGAARTEILRGSVLSNLDEMCVWSHAAVPDVLYTAEDVLPDGVEVGDVKTPGRAAYTEDNEQLNRMKVSDVEGDPNVAGVFQCWDDGDDEGFTDDFYCAMTGDFVIRIAQGTTVARGDLLMSAGDGTAKPQDDDIIRSKTIAKVTSTVVSTTHADGSYCVPCVLMAC